MLYASSSNSRRMGASLTLFFHLDIIKNHGDQFHLIPKDFSFQLRPGFLGERAGTFRAKPIVPAWITGHFLAKPVEPTAPLPPAPVQLVMIRSQCLDGPFDGLHAFKRCFCPDSFQIFQAFLSVLNRFFPVHRLTSSPIVPVPAPCKTLPGARRGRTKGHTICTGRRSGAL